MALHLITGYAGQEHITSADQGAYNMGTFGEGEFVLDRGSKFAATVVTNNSITIANGEALMQGRFIKLPIGTTESVTIDNGASGMKRKDLIVLRYSKDASTGVESVALAVRKGTPLPNSPLDPILNTGTITDGNDLVNEMPLYRVNLDGLNIVSLDTMFSVKTTMVEYMDEYQLPVADANTLGGVKVGANINLDSDGKISLQTANDSRLGLVKVGDHLTSSLGVISVKKGSAYQFGVVQLGPALTKEGDYTTISDCWYSYENGHLLNDISIGAKSSRQVTFVTASAISQNSILLLFANLSLGSYESLMFVPYKFELDNENKLHLSGTVINFSDSAKTIPASTYYRIYYQALTRGYR